MDRKKKKPERLLFFALGARRGSKRMRGQPPSSAISQSILRRARFAKNQHAPKTVAANGSVAKNYELAARANADPFVGFLRRNGRLGAFGQTDPPRRRRPCGFVVFLMRLGAGRNVVFAPARAPSCAAQMACASIAPDLLLILREFPKMPAFLEFPEICRPQQRIKKQFLRVRAPCDKILMCVFVMFATRLKAG